MTILDQPEPQVEIETRIVIATHNFSRDLGAQLSAGVVNFGRGGLANGTTLPASGSGGGGGGGGGGGNAGALQSGPNPFGVFGGLAGTNQPIGSLGAAAASTVIGLTTGVFGTAQISLLITMAETKGQVKTVATPRVTALNNRPAQIESGQQIPVQTTQAAGGTAVVTTTFVSVPLRLSITPQITDVGTVVLRVTIENNTSQHRHCGWWCPRHRYPAYAVRGPGPRWWHDDHGWRAGRSGRQYYEQDPRLR